MTIHPLPMLQRNILEAVVKIGPVRNRADLSAESGYKYKSLGQGIVELRKKGLMRRYQDCQYGLYEATEKGKIVLAIIMGQETKQRLRRIEQKKSEQYLLMNPIVRKKGRPPKARLPTPDWMQIATL